MFLLYKKIIYAPPSPAVAMQKSIPRKLNAKIYKIFNNLHSKRTFFDIFYPIFTSPRNIAQQRVFHAPPLTATTICKIKD